VRAASDCCQSIQRIPLKRARAIAGQIAIGIIDERFAAAPCDSHIVAVRRRVAVRVRRRHGDHVIASGDRCFSFKAVIALGVGRLAIYGHGRWFIGRAANRQRAALEIPGSLCQMVRFLISQTANVQRGV
jgi:hypothetical protein